MAVPAKPSGGFLDAWDGGTLGTAGTVGQLAKAVYLQYLRKTAGLTVRTLTHFVVP